MGFCNLSDLLPSAICVDFYTIFKDRLFLFFVQSKPAPPKTQSVVKGSYVISFSVCLITLNLEYKEGYLGDKKCLLLSNS